MNEITALEEYMFKNDWRVYENSNRLFSVGGLKTHVAEKAIANYVLKKVYPEEISRAHKEGFFHLHDLSSGIVPYCAGWSIQDILVQGFGGVRGTISSSPPKHFSSALGQLMNFIGVVQQEWAGAQAVNSFDTILAPFVRNDRLSYREVKQFIQEFIYNLNVTLRFAHETPFTNISFDLTVPDDLENNGVIIGGEMNGKIYGDFQNEMDMINRAFLEVMYNGDRNSNIFRFPIPTYTISDNFDWHNGVSEWLKKVTAKFGLPYFQNCISSGLKQHDTRSMCCRLSISMSELKRKTGGLFGYNDKTGSLAVCTINLPRIGFLSKTDNEFYENLYNYMKLARDSLEIKRKVVTKMFDSGLMPYSRQYLQSFDHHFSTIGVIGGEECCQNFLGCSITDDYGLDFMINVLNFMREKIKDFQEESGNLFNLESSPSEGCSFRLPSLDLKNLKGIYTSGTKTNPYYTNSTQLPVGYTDSLAEAIRHQQRLQSLYTGGTVFHCFLPEKMPDPQGVGSLVDKICRKTTLPYFTMTPSFSICKQCGYIPGEIYQCGKCGNETDVYSRIVGYYSPLSHWNLGKKQEFKERKTFKI